MKKILLLASVSALVLTTSCNNNSEPTKTHQHEDGSSHANHDTIKPVQQEFNVADTIKKDSAVHTHKNGQKHTH